ncbi:hypothetical protein FS842_008151 [Serendipita sp. 407]|nr:hypothetical protein FS842_008151 [Serendipita sp. 407]
MDPNQTQELEIEALRAIYGDDFRDIPPPKVWKGAATFPEFTIRVRPNDTDLHGRVEFSLHVKFPKTYPKVLPTLSVESSTGMSKVQINQMLGLLKTEGQKAIGREMILELVMFCQDWITINNSAIKGVGDDPNTSLAVQMSERATSKQQEHEKQSQEAVLRQRQLDSEQAAAFAKEIDAQKEEKRRLRILNTSVDGPENEWHIEDEALMNVFSFEDEIECRGYHFHSVALSNPVNDGAGVILRADPQCELKKGPIHIPVLEAYRIAFDNPHYKTNYGYRKIIDIRKEIEVLRGIDNPNLIKIYAVHLEDWNHIPRMTLLMEQRSGASLRDILLHSDGLRIDRTLDYLGQLFLGLGSLHAHNICHRGLTADCISLTPISQTPTKSLLKIGRPSYYTRIMELHRSNHIVGEVAEPWSIPEAWLPPEAVDKPLEYPPSRDIWSAGIILLQMLRGFAVTDQFEDVQTALQYVEDIPQTLFDFLRNIFSPNRKRSPSCLELTRQLTQITGNTIMSSSIAIPADLKTPMPRHDVRHSPEVGFFASTSKSQVVGPQRASRYQEDWEELEFLGKGGFGSVVKARNKLDGRIYAIKKVKLRGTENDDRIFREVNALSRLNHRYIVRYYATWLEVSQRNRRSSSATNIDGDSTDEDDEDEDTTDSDTTASRKKPQKKSFDEENILMYDLDDLTVHSKSRSGRSFPSIHFGEETSSQSITTVEDDEDDSSETEEEDPDRRPAVVKPKVGSRVLYIQMEFVEQQTLRELIIEDGLTEEHAWTLFRQVLEAVVHISSLGIIHRDFKPSNIFLSATGDCKIGDFGLATSSLAAVDPSDVENGRLTLSDGEMTSGVGTSLYVAPEVLHGKGRNHSKADMYSLGIVFFEMNYPFKTGAERVAVLQQLRQPEIIFPNDFDRPAQKKIITSLLQHDPAKRPTASELFQSSLLPQQMEDAYIKEASRLMTNPESPHYAKLLASLFSRPVTQIRDVLYDEEERPEHVALDGVVEDRLIDCFQLHGAVSMDPLLLMPAKAVDVSDPKTTIFLDRQGELVALPKHLIQSFARLAARMGIERIKRFHIGNIYRQAPGGGHPKFLKVAIFDIITSDPSVGVSEAEAIAVVNEIIEIFPGLNATTYDIYISHSSVCEAALAKIPEEQKRNVVSILDNNKTALSLKKTLLTKLGLTRSVLDDLDALLQPADEIEATIARLAKTSFAGSLLQVFDEIRAVVRFSSILGVKRRIHFRPWQPNDLFTSGLVFEVSKGTKRSDIIASGGRYDKLLASYHAPSNPLPSSPLRATGVQIAVDKITAALAAHQRASIRHLIKDKRTYGLWSPRRCDVYICGYQTGGLADRLKVASILWENNISADIMYDGAIDDSEDVLIGKCQNEGILFLVYPRGNVNGRPAYKIKSVLRGTEQDASQHELVSGLQALLLEQSRFDKEQEHTTGVTKVKDTTEVPIILSPDNSTRKHRHTTKALYQSKANAAIADIRDSIQCSNHGVIGVDMHPSAWNAITANQAWITNDTAWRTLLEETPQLQKEVGVQLREHINAKRNEGKKLVFVVSLRDEKLFLFHLQ